MATITAAWKIVWMLGSLILGSSYLMAKNVTLLDIDFGNAPPVFKDVMYGLSCIVLFIFAARGFVALLHSIEKLKADKAKNKYLNKKYNGIK